MSIPDLARLQRSAASPDDAPPRRKDLRATFGNPQPYESPSQRSSSWASKAARRAFSSDRIAAAACLSWSQFPLGRWHRSHLTWLAVDVLLGCD